MPHLDQLKHVSVLVSDLQQSLDFYHGLLGLDIDSSRPDLGYPGAWLNIGQQQIHLLQLPNPDPVSERPAHGGRDRHIAMAATNYDGFRKKLDDSGINYTTSKSGRQALFLRDPDGNAVEIIGSD